MMETNEISNFKNEFIFWKEIICFVIVETDLRLG
jgi:hypothetical protein